MSCVSGLIAFPPFVTYVIVYVVGKASLSITGKSYVFQSVLHVVGICAPS